MPHDGAPAARVSGNHDLPCLVRHRTQASALGEAPLAKGRDLYRENCIVCHDIDKAETRKIGPSMFRLFQNEKLPFSGGTPSEEYVNFKIQLGGDVMPAFTGRLTPQQIDLIVDYIKSAR